MERLTTLIDKYKLPLALSLIGIVLIIGGAVVSGISKSKFKNPQTSSGQGFPKESLVQTQKISVDVSGAVKNPGVYHIESNSRIEDAVKAAGGFSENANGEYISKYLNMAQKISDGSKIYIPPVGEKIPSGNQNTGSVSGVSTTSIVTKVNINTASQSELEALSGIGPVTASKIISDRPYMSVEELLSKKVVSKAVFEKIKDQIVFY